MKLTTHHFGIERDMLKGVTFVACSHNDDGKTEFTLRVGVQGGNTIYRYELTEWEAKQLRNFLNNYVPK